MPTSNSGLTPSRRSASQAADQEEITSSYRASYGGPAGTSVSSWTSRSTASPRASLGSTPASSLSRQLSQSYSQQSIGRTTSVDVTSKLADLKVASDIVAETSPSASASNAVARAEAALAAAKRQLAADNISPSKLSAYRMGDGTVSSSQEALDASNKATALVSDLTTGSPKQQLSASTSLKAILAQHGEPVQRAVHTAGGTHMLQTLLTSKASSPELQRDCAGALAELCKYQPALDELAFNQEVPSEIIRMSLYAIKSNGDPVYTSLFKALVACDRESVKAGCSSHKAVYFLSDILGLKKLGGGPCTEIENSALSALEALCIADPGPNLRKLSWGGGLASLIAYLDPPTSPHAASALHLLLLALDQDRRHAESLCIPELIEALSVLIADPEVPLTVQIGAAKVLTAIAALRSRKDDSTQALNDYALPRACEILRQADEFWTEGAPSKGSVQGIDLHAACAALVAHLSAGSPLCCHVVLFHAEALRTIVSVLTGCHEFGLVETVLAATGNYAASPHVQLY